MRQPILIRDDASEVANREVADLQTRYPDVHPKVVAYWYNRFNCNPRRTTTHLELGRLRPSVLMLPGQHSVLAQDRPQGGSSLSLVDTVYGDSDTIDSARQDEVPGFVTDRRQRISLALKSTQDRLADKLHLLGDTNRLFVYAMVPDLDNANNS